MDLSAAGRAVDLIRRRARTTYRPEVVGDIGAFAGLFSLDPSRYEDPLLVSSTDGVGTKVMIAQMLGRHETIGIDLVAMSVDDVAALGAEPLFFLDYIVAGKVVPEVIDEIGAGIAEGCRQAGCSLIGGEIAEHPGHLEPGSYDLAGFCVGVVERSRAVTGERIKAGDAVLGLASSGLHSNGYSLARKALLEVAGLGLDSRPPGLGATLGEELLAPTRIYARALVDLCARVEVSGIAHITGGGIPENLARIIPGGLCAAVADGSWPVPPIFGLIAASGGVGATEMLSTFNMGLGAVVVVPADQAAAAAAVLGDGGQTVTEIGAVEPAPAGDPRVRLA